MPTYDLFYEDPKDGGIWNAHDIADDAEWAAREIAAVVRDGAPWAQIEIRRTAEDFADRDASNQDTKPE